MKAFLSWTLLLGLVGLLLFSVSTPVKAQTGDAKLDALLEGKEVVHDGSCLMETPEKLAEGLDTVKMRLSCVVGIDPKTPKVHFIGIRDDNGYTILIRGDSEKVQQEVIWRRPIGTSI